MASTFTCTTLGSTCEATCATGSSSGICGGACAATCATCSCLGPGSSEHPANKTVTSTRTSKTKRKLSFRSNAFGTSCRRPGRFLHHRVYTKAAPGGFRCTLTAWKRRRTEKRSRRTSPAPGRPGTTSPGGEPWPGSAEGGVLEIECGHTDDTFEVRITHPELKDRRMSDLARILERFLDGYEITPTRAVLVKRLS